MRVVGLPLHLWSCEVFKRIDDGCGGFVVVDEDTDSLTELQWAQILVKHTVRVLPNTAQVVVGSVCYSFHLWWETRPCFPQVVSAGRNYREDVLREGEEEGESSWLALGVKERKWSS